MTATMPTRKILTTTAAFLLAVFLVGRTALALDPPPSTSDQQRAWLTGNIVTDMQKSGVFTPDDFGKVGDIIRQLTDDQLALLCRYYFLTRSATLQDSAAYASQQLGETYTPTVTDLPVQTVACYDQITTLGTPCTYLAQVEYASVPGWCVASDVCVPPAYYAGGNYVGCCGYAGYGGVWAAPVYAAYYNPSSAFYGYYHARNWGVYYRRTVAAAARWSTGAGFAYYHGGHRGYGYNGHVAGHGAGYAYGNAGHLNAGHVNAAHVNAGHVNAAHVNAGHVNAGHVHAAHVNAAHANAAHANAWHANAAHAKTGHASAAHAHASHPAAPAAHAAHAQAHAAHPAAHAAHAQPHPQHVAQAHSGHGKHK